MDGGSVEGPMLDTSGETIRFNIFVDGIVVKGVASREFLQTKYGAGPDPDTWLTAYTANMREIASIVAERYRAEFTSPVLLHTDA